MKWWPPQFAAPNVFELRRLALSSRYRRVAVAGAVLLLIVLFVAALQPLLTHGVPVDPERTLAPPSAAHPFGTDAAGADLFVAVAVGLTRAVVTTVAGTVVALLAGIAVGVAAGISHRGIDATAMGLMRALGLVSAYALAPALVAALGVSMRHEIAVLGLVGMPGFASVVRLHARRCRDNGYLDYARAAGNPRWRVLGVHLLPQVLSGMAELALRQASALARVGASVGFVGPAPPLPGADLGALIREGAEQVLTGRWWVAAYPGIALLILIFALAAVVGRVGPAVEEAPA
jgi:peptide/nickel transport system permease protein